MAIPRDILARIAVFATLDQDLAVRHAAAGGIAVHLHAIVFPHSPRCFRQAIERGEYIAHVFGQDADELCRLARAVGVRRTYIDRPGSHKQHHDLCGTPLKLLLAAIGQHKRLWRES